MVIHMSGRFAGLATGDGTKWSDSRTLMTKFIRHAVHMNTGGMMTVMNFIKIAISNSIHNHMFCIER